MSTRIAYKEQADFTWGVLDIFGDREILPLPHKRLIESDYRFRLVPENYWDKWIQPILAAYYQEPSNPIFQKADREVQNADPHRLYILILKKELEIGRTRANDGTQCICMDEQAFFSLINWIAAGAEIAATEYKTKPEAAPFKPIINVLEEQRQDKARHESWRQQQALEREAAERRKKIGWNIVKVTAALAIISGLVLYNLFHDKFSAASVRQIGAPAKKPAEKLPPGVAPLDSKSAPGIAEPQPDKNPRNNKKDKVSLDGNLTMILAQSRFQMLH